MGEDADERGDRRSIPYPTDHLLAVFDLADTADAAAVAVRAAGFAPGDIVVLRGDGPGSGIRALGRRHGTWTRILRAIQFTTMDQLPDLVVYEAAIRDGRTVIAVHVRERPRMLAARAHLRDGGAHFINYFGRLATEELDRWRGPELDLPGYLQR
jgi:hypothetical protein